MMIAYDKARCETVDDETGDYLKAGQSHYSVPEQSFTLWNTEGKALLVAVLIPDGKLTEVADGKMLSQKWTLLQAWEPRKNTPYQTPTNFEVSQDLIDRLTLFLLREAETEFKWVAPPQFEFIDGRTGEGASK